METSQPEVEIFYSRATPEERARATAQLRCRADEIAKESKERRIRDYHTVMELRAHYH